MDYALLIDRLPNSNEAKDALNGSWQGGGVIATGLVAASRCGLKCSIMGTVADDIFGEYCRNDFRKHNIDQSHLLTRIGKHTDVSTIISDMETNGRCILYRSGNCKALSIEEIDLSFIEQADYLYISEVTDCSVMCAKYAREHGINVLIDAGYGSLGSFKRILPYINYFIASEDIYNSAFEDMDYQRHMEELRKHGPDVVIFTFGAKGVKALSHEGFFDIPSYSVPVVDTVGAGDTFHGAFFYGLKHHLSLTESIQFASATSAIKCTYMGGRAGIPTPEITFHFMKTGEILKEELDSRNEYYAWGLNNIKKEN